MNGTDRAIAAVFDDRESALDAFAVLKSDGFEDAWMGVTKPAEIPDDDAKPESPLEEPVRNDITESSDGILGTIGRFFSGEGNSLRRSLEDHGVDPLDAVDIDTHLAPMGAVITVFGGERAELATSILRGGGGRIGLDRAASRPADLAVRDTSHAPVIVRPAPLVAHEEVFFERRPITISPAARADRSEERKGLDDLL